MRLSEGHKEHVASRLNKLWGDTRCPICKAQRWTILDNVMELREYRVPEIVPQIKQQVVPLIVMVCGVCANTALFSAIALELLKVEGGLVDV